MTIIIKKLPTCYCKKIKQYDCDRCNAGNIGFVTSLMHYFGDGANFNRFFKRSHYDFKRKHKKEFVKYLKNKLGK